MPTTRNTAMLHVWADFLSPNVSARFQDRARCGQHLVRGLCGRSGKGACGTIWSPLAAVWQGCLWRRLAQAVSREYRCYLSFMKMCARDAQIVGTNYTIGLPEWSTIRRCGREGISQGGSLSALERCAL